MFIDKDSIQIKYGNNAYVSMGQYLLEVKYGFNKLWSEDTGRNLAGVSSGTLRGIFPKLILHFRKLTPNEFKPIAKMLDYKNQTVKYYDPNKEAYVEIETYTGDYEITNKDIVDENTPNEDFNVSFIAKRKRP